LPSATPHDRGRRLQPDADRAALVEVGRSETMRRTNVLGGRYRCHLPPTS
jgi:hypothetical protein